MANTDGTIDITNLVEVMRSSFVTLAVNTAFAAAVAVPGLTWLAWPVISSLFRRILQWVADTISKMAVMEAFFLNTAVRKASQAADYTTAVKAKNNLPSTATDQEYEDAEDVEMLAFRNFVRVSN